MSGRSTLIARLRRAPGSLALAARLATARFPAAACLIAVFAIVANAEVAAFGWWPNWPRILSALAGASVASVAVRVGTEARAAPGSPLLLVLPVLAALAVGLAIGFGVPLELHAPPLVLACLIAIPLAPFLGRGTAREFWAFTLWTNVGVLFAFLSVLLFCLGLLAILEMVRFLFSVGFGWRAYAHIWTTALALIGPLFALGRIPAVAGEGLGFSQGDGLVRSVRALLEWIGVPLALATGVILHAYGVRVLATGDLSVSTIGWIVTFYAMLVLGLRIGLDPFLLDGSLPTRAFRRIWAAMLPFPLALLAYAVGAQVAADGVTLERYFLLLAAAAGGIALALQLAPRLRGDPRAILAVPLVLLLVSVAGPQSAANVVGRSQEARIAERFLNPEGRLDLARESGADRWELRTRVDELIAAGQLWRLGPYLAEDAGDLLRSAGGSAGTAQRDVVLGSLGLLDFERTTGPTRSFWAMSGQRLETGGYDFAFQGRLVEEGSGREPPGELALHFDGPDLVLTYRGIADRVDLGPRITELDPSIFAGRDDVAAPVLDVATDGGRALRLRIESLTVGAEDRPLTGVVTLLGRDRDWPASGRP